MIVPFEWERYPSFAICSHQGIVDTLAVFYIWCGRSRLFLDSFRYFLNTIYTLSRHLHLDIIEIGPRYHFGMSYVWLSPYILVWLLSWMRCPYHFVVDLSLRALAVWWAHCVIHGLALSLYHHMRFVWIVYRLNKWRPCIVGVQLLNQKIWFTYATNNLFFRMHVQVRQSRASGLGVIKVGCHWYRTVTIGDFQVIHCQIVSSSLMGNQKSLIWSDAKTPKTCTREWKACTLGNAMQNQKCLEHSMFSLLSVSTAEFGFPHCLMFCWLSELV